ncbi:MAG: DUF3472 domain-containing protein [Pirellulales bacterium]|nr:DUF3472 domain-containing protein [Pirellulales bacterium]
MHGIPPRMTYAQPLRLWLVPLIAGIAMLSGSPCQADEKLAGIACRSVHLQFPTGQGTAFYNEVTIKKSAPGTYFCVCGFNAGYFGLQELGDGKKLLIFSVWDPGNQNDPNQVAESQRVKLHDQDPQVRIGRFGNEGTGGQSFYDFDWQLDETYRFLVTARKDAERTAYTGWFYHPGEKTWKKLVTFSTLKNGELLGGCYSFVEDFRRNRVSATQTRTAQFGNSWFQDEQGQWRAIDNAKFTADSNPATNIDSGVQDKQFFLSTGGEIKNTGTQLNDKLKLIETQSQLPELPAELTKSPVQK